MRRYASESQLLETTFGVDNKVHRTYGFPPNKISPVSRSGTSSDEKENDRSEKPPMKIRSSVRFSIKDPAPEMSMINSDRNKGAGKRNIPINRSLRSSKANSLGKVRVDVQPKPEPAPRTKFFIKQAMVTPNDLKMLLSGSSNASRQVSEHMGPAPHSINATNGLHLSRPVSNNNLPLALSNGVSIPINLEIGDYKVWDYVNEVISRGWSDCGSFRLSPAYALYLALRFFHSNSKPFIGQFFSKITTHLGPIARDCNSRDELLFWLANTSELTFLVENDSELRDSRANQLASMVETIFKQLCTVLTGLIRPASQPMLDTNIDMEAGCAELIQLLDSTMREARTSRLNPALTIQVSGHMFHSINATIFNALIGMGYTRVPLTSKLGRLLQSRLLQLHRWAEQMGVELAAECHLDRSRQAANLLVAHKNDLASLGTTCYKLNSLQVRYLLTNFDPKDGESVCDNDVINRVVGLAERQADQLTREDDLAVTLEESEYLALPFLLPQDGYVAEQLRDVPEGLARYLLSLQDKRVLQSVQILNSQNGAPKNCITQQPSQTNGASTNGNGQTTVLMPASIPQAPLIRSASQSTLTSLPTPFGDSFNSNVMQQDELLRVTLRRGTSGIGLSIVAAQGVGDRQVGIYVKKVVDGTPAATAPSSSNPSSLSASMPSPTQNGRYNPPPAYPMQKYGSQQSVQSNIPPPSYQKHQQITASRSSAFAPPTAIQGQNGHQQNQFDFGTRHVRSISASDLYQGQNDPNASFSQRSITSTTGNGNFDKLPAHYRASSRPMVIQPGRPCPSPSSLRRAQSPSSLYRPPSANGLNRPPSASELFAPPKSPNPLQVVGYSSNNRESHAQDMYRASMPSPPAAQSSPRASSEGFRPLPYSASASLPQPIFQKPTYQPLGGNHPPKAFVGPTTSGYQGQRQEPAIVRPVDVNIAREYERDTERQTTFGVIKGAVPTAITQALQLQQQQGGAPRVVVRAPRQSGIELDVRELERTNIALMSQDAVNDELDRLDAKGINMTESETMRYR
ncbi:hypothetical protein WR25_27183 isoform C [Diploscapter pachys]|nr:hypothetical protein WR25_27183 isoform C [Diploscapter pachys]